MLGLTVHLNLPVGPDGLREIGFLLANHSHDSCGIDKSNYAQHAQEYCQQDPTTSMLLLSQGAQRHLSFGGGIELILSKFWVSETHVEIIIKNVKPD